MRLILVLTLILLAHFSQSAPTDDNQTIDKTSSSQKEDVAESSSASNDDHLPKMMTSSSNVKKSNLKPSDSQSLPIEIGNSQKIFETPSGGESQIESPPTSTKKSHESSPTMTSLLVSTLISQLMGHNGGGQGLPSMLTVGQSQQVNNGFPSTTNGFPSMTNGGTANIAKLLALIGQQRGQPSMTNFGQPKFLGQPTNQQQQFTTNPFGQQPNQVIVSVTIGHSLTILRNIHRFSDESSTTDGTTSADGAATATSLVGQPTTGGDTLSFDG